VKAALIGLGRMGLRHLQVLRELGLDVVGASDAQEAARGKARVDFDLAPAALFANAEDMIGRFKPELVVVATTAPSHAALVCAAAGAGARAVLCEKPMAVSLAQCDAMIDACKASGTRLAINHQMRFMEQYTVPKALVREVSFGGLASISIVAGNIGIANNGSHYFEMFRYMTDETPATVAAWFSADRVPNPRGPQFDDRGGAVRLTTNSGKRFYMDAGTDQGHGMQVTYAGRNGRLEIDELAGRGRLVVRKAENSAAPTTRYGMPWDERELAVAPADAVAPTRAVLSALLAGKDYPDGAVGRMAVEVLVAAYLSHEQGGVMIDLAKTNLPRERMFAWA
jgi:predicted dehydrogenase